MSLLLAWAGKGLPARERRYVLGALGLAVVLRVAVVGALPLLADHARQSFRVFVPDSAYTISRSLWLRNFFVGTPVGARDLFEAFTRYADTNYYYLLAYFQVLLGPSPYGAHLFSAALYLAGAVLLYRQVRGQYGRLPAYTGLVLLLFLPSLFLWSISALKDAAYFFLMATLLVASLKIVRARSWTVRVVALAILAASLLLIGGLRDGGLVIAAAGILLGLTMRAVTLRASVLALTVIAALALTLYGISRPGVQFRLTQEMRAAASRHMGHVNTTGHAYKLLDQHYYTAGPTSVAELSLTDGLRFLTWSSIRFVTVPEPWDLTSAFELALLPQQIVWYVLVVLALSGCFSGLSRDALLTWLLIGVIAVGSAAIAVNSGNVGTLIRHRDSVVPFVVWLSGAGGTWVLVRLARRFQPWVADVSSLPVGNNDGRLMSRLNLIDGAVGLVVLVLVPLGYAAYLFLRTPAPEIARVEPDSWREGETPRVTLRGRHLRSFLKVFVGRTGEPIVLLDGHTHPPEAAFLLRGPDSAELEMPRLVPGTYDLVLFDAAEAVGRKAVAFTVAPPPAAFVGRISVRVSGAFTGLQPAETPKLSSGTQFSAGGDEGSVEIVKTGSPQGDVTDLRVGDTTILVPVENSVRMPATLLVHCATVAGQCRLGDVAVTPGSVLTLPGPTRSLQFRVERLGTAVDTPALAADAMVRFVVRRELLPLIEAGDRDSPFLSVGGSPTGAVLVGLHERREMTSQSGFVVGQTMFGIPEQVVSLEATVRIPVTRESDRWQYRARTVRAGEVFAFETPTYTMRGWILQVALPRTTAQATPAPAAK